MTNPSVSCYPPCTFVFPPWILPQPSIISRPPATLTVQESWPTVTTLAGGVTSTGYITTTKVTTVTIPPVTTTIISNWNVQWTDTAQQTIYLTSSVVFPPVTLTEDPLTTTISGKVTTITGATYTYSPGPFPIFSNLKPTTSGEKPGTSQSTTIFPPPAGSTGSVGVKPGPPGPPCKLGQICGKPCLINCLPPAPCIGICGCIGPICKSNCIGPGCGGGGGGGGGGSDPGNPDDPDNQSCTKQTVTDCDVACSVKPTDGSLTTSCYTTTCSEVTECSATPTTKTSRTTVGCPTLPPYVPWYTDEDEFLPTIPGGNFGSMITPNPTSFIDCLHHGPDPDAGVVDAYCICSSSTFAESIFSSESCAYTTMPSKITTVPVQRSTVTDIDNCDICTYQGQQLDGCEDIPNCVVGPTPTPDPVETDPPYPTISADIAGNPPSLCNNDNEILGVFVTFTVDQAREVANSICDRGNTLTPDQAVGYTEATKLPNGRDLVAHVAWAKNQDGCQPKKDYPLSGDACFALFVYIYDNCVDQAQHIGGGWVDNDQFGCILVSLSAPD